MNIETVKRDNIPVPISRIGLGTWAIGGWMWGGSDEAASIKIIRHAWENHGKSLLAFAIRWILDRGETMTALWGARNAGQIDAVEQVFGWELSSDDYAQQMPTILA